MRQSLSLFCGRRSLTDYLQVLEKKIRNSKGSDFKGGSFWEEVAEASKLAHQLKETDSVYTVVQSILLRGASLPLPMWSVVAGQLLPYAGIESSAVLHYPGLSDESIRRRNLLTESSKSIHLSGDPRSNGYSVVVSRETLLLTGGTVPLSARTPCSDGLLFASFLDHFTTFVERKLQDESTSREELIQTVNDVGEAIAAGIALNQYSIQPLLLYDSLTKFLDCFFNLVLGESGERQDLFLTFISTFSFKVSHNALGARLVFGFLDEKIKSLSQEPSVEGEKLVLNIINTTVPYFIDYYNARPRDFPVSKRLQHLYEELSVVFQRNANHNNALNLNESEESHIVLLITLALLRSLRIEVTAPDEFLRVSLPIVERCAASPEVEVEMIKGKVGLLEYFTLQDTEKETIYEDLMRSLRHLVTLRDAGSHTEEDTIQSAHITVIRALCASQQPSRVQDAYDIVTAHKYHGLSVTQEIIAPLTDVLSRKGDGRVFNLVDLCVLYSNNEINNDIINHLFRCCLVAGDHYRAKSLLHLFEETISGFLLKSSEEVRHSLQRLKVIPPDPQHLFTEEEDKLVKDAMGIPWTPPQPLPR